MKRDQPYIYLWEYFVRKDSIIEFEQTYGLYGDWVGLFRNDRNYVETQLHKDMRNPQRYVTIDRWTSEKAYFAFRRNYSEEFKNLDERCERLTIRESEIGAFELVQ